MEEPIEKILREQFSKLPVELRDVLLSFDLRPKLKSIMERNNLMVDQAGKVEDEVALILFGLEHPNDFVENLKEHVGVEHERAHAIANDVDEEILKPIKASLVGFYEGQATGTDVAPSPLPSPDVQKPEAPQQTTQFVGRKLSESTASVAGNDAPSANTSSSTDPYRETVE